VEVTDSRRAYALNGTFDTGVQPWTTSIVDPSNGFQNSTASYNSTQKHVVATNVGRYSATPTPRYTHWEATEIFWVQTINNSPLASNFSLSFDFLYASGPLDPQGNDFVLDVWLVFFVDTTGYYISLLTGIDSRNTWYFVSDIPFYFASPPSSFDVMFGLYITESVGVVNLVLSPDADYDEDGVADGVENARTIDLRLDNIALEGVVPADFEATDMRFHAGEFEAPVTGTGTAGTAVITNPSFWTTSPLHVEITANATISFTYKVTLLLHQYVNSSWTSDPTKPGISYTITQGHSASLKLYTYVAGAYGLENTTIDIEYPSDWENVTIIDPLLNDLTLQCDVNPGALTIPTSLLNRIGWWEVQLDGPNYAKSLTTQKYHDSTGQWSDDSLFRAGNMTRVHAEVGTATNRPDQGEPAQVTWIMPNGTVWREENIETIVDGAFNGTPSTLGGENTTAGLWAIELFWTNGTEIAFAVIGFDVYHASSLAAIQSVIETEAGSVITSILRYTDTSNEEYLVDDEASIAANWSSGTVTYNPNLVRSWWEADFDTSLVGGGEFIVVVNASQPYYDTTSCQFTLRVFYETTLDVTSVGGLLATSPYLDDYTVYLSYTLTNSSPIDGAEITLDYSGPDNGVLSLDWTDMGGGNYSFTLRGVVSGLYAVTMTATKQYHYSASDTFTLLVTEAGAVLSSRNGSSGLVRMGQTYRLVIHYENNTGFGLPGANVTVTEVSPSSGLSYLAFTYSGNGDYYTYLTPSTTGTYTVIIRATLQNHVERVIAFTLTAMETPTVLTVGTSGASVAMDQAYTVQLLLVDDESSPVAGATITVLNPPSGLLFQSCVPLPGGRYNITIQPLQIGTYQIAFKASCENYQYSTAGFTLVVGFIPTSLEVLGGASEESIPFTEVCEITVTYNRTDLNQPVDGASFAMTSTPDSGLSWEVRNATGGYRLTFRTETVGVWMILITSNKTGYVDGFFQFKLEVTSIPSTINEISLINDLIYGRSYNFTFNYLMYNSTGIENAIVSVQGAGFEWVQVTGTGSGHYRATIAPQATGTYSLTIVFEKEGFDSRSSALSFVVVPASLSIIDVVGLEALEGENTTLSLRLVKSGTGEPISGASVTFQIMTLPGPGDITPLQEISPGRYQATFVMPSYGTTQKIRIYVSLDNYELDVDSFEASLNPLLSESAQLARTVRQMSPFIFIMMCAIIGVSTNRVSANRKRRRQIQALATKRRFDDMKSLIGVIVLHKSSGLPVFSKILKSGLDESLISGFITAITQFRTEFGVDETEGAVIPISDIIRVVRTKNLMCAFITLGSPTDSQQEKLLRFARSVGLMFDSFYDLPPTGIVDPEMSTQYQKLFDDLLDGHLLDNYGYVEDMKLPRSLRTVAKAVGRLENPEKFGLETLAGEMTGLGVEETTVYTQIVDAIEKHYLVPLPSEDDGHSEAPDPDS